MEQHVLSRVHDLQPPMPNPIDVMAVEPWLNGPWLNCALQLAACCRGQWTFSLMVITTFSYMLHHLTPKDFLRFTLDRLSLRELMICFVN